MLTKSTSVAVGAFKLVGRSRAGEATCFTIPELKWMFDCGARIHGWTPKILFLTHTHSDHVHYLTHIKNEEKPPLVYLPQEAESYVKSYLIAHQEMTDCMLTEKKSQEGETGSVDCVLRPTMPEEEIRFRQAGSEYVVRTLKMTHRIPCLGFSIFKMKSKLKEEYVGMPSREIGKLKKEGVEVTTAFEEPLICFLGDTTATVFSDYPELLSQQATIVVECSFFKEEDLARAEKTKHMHWNHLKPYVERNPDTMFVLTHFSLKYSSLWLRQFFVEQQKLYRNIHPMLIEEEIIEEWEKSEPSETNFPKCGCKLCAN